MLRWIYISLRWERGDCIQVMVFLGDHVAQAARRLATGPTARVSEGWLSSLLRIQTAPGVHSAYYKMSTGVKAAELCIHRLSWPIMGISFNIVLCEDVQLALMISPRIATAGKQGVNYVVLHMVSSCTEVVLNGIAAFPERFNPSCHCAKWQRYIATCFTQFQVTFLCTTSFSTWYRPVRRLSWTASLPSRNALTHRATALNGNATSPHVSRSSMKHFLCTTISCHFIFWPRNIGLVL